METPGADPCGRACSDEQVSAGLDAVPSAPGFTPGPWTVQPPWSGFSSIRDASGLLIFGLARGGDDAAMTAETCEANATLIAASPTTFEALRAYDASMYRKWLMGPDGHPATLDEADRIIWKNARAALNKALGQKEGA